VRIPRLSAHRPSHDQHCEVSLWSLASSYSCRESSRCCLLVVTNGRAIRWFNLVTLETNSGVLRSSPPR
jgi:hypothetical protein